MKVYPILLLLVACLTAVESTGQTRVRDITVADPPTCSACRIQLRPLVRVGDPDGDGSLPRMPSQVLQDSRGRIFLTLYSPPTPAYQFDSTGHFVRRIGRQGSGPGEYQSAFLVRGAADSFAIIDFFNNRRNIMAPGGILARTTPTPVLSPNVVRLTNGDQVVSGAGGFSIVNNDGVFVRSTGRSEITKPTTGPANIRASQKNAFWAFGISPYRIEQWRADGIHILTLNRATPFFPNVSRVNSGADGNQPTAQLQEVFEDSSGVLWTIVLVAGKDWKEWLGPKSISTKVLPYQKRRMDKLHDSVIEAFDAKTGALLQSTRLTGYYSHFLRDNVVGQHVEDDNGFSYLQLHHIELIRH